MIHVYECARVWSCSCKVKTKERGMEKSLEIVAVEKKVKMLGAQSTYLEFM